MNWVNGVKRIGRDVVQREKARIQSFKIFPSKLARIFPAAKQIVEKGKSKNGFHCGGREGGRKMKSRTVCFHVYSIWCYTLTCETPIN